MTPRRVPSASMAGGAAVGLVVLLLVVVIPTRPSVASTPPAAFTFNPTPLGRIHSPLSTPGYIALAHALPPAVGASAAPIALRPEAATAGIANISVDALRFVNDSSYVAQTETSIAVSPTNASRVVGGFNDFRGFFCPTTPFNLMACPRGGTESATGFSTSSNGGVALGKSGDLPGAVGRVRAGRTGFSGFFVPFGDPSVAPAPGGDFYIASLAVSNNSSANGIELAVSNANLWRPGACGTWLPTPWGNPCWSARLVFANLSAYAGTFEDKDTIAVDSNTHSSFFGDAFVAWDHVNPDGTSQTYLARCTPRLACTMLSGGGAPVVSGPDQFVAWSTVALDRAGRVYAAWCDLGTATAAGPDYCRIRSSTTGGTSFAANRTVLSYGAPSTELPNATYAVAYATEQFRTASIPSLTADTSSHSSDLFFSVALCTRGHYYNFQQSRTTYLGLGVCSVSSVFFTRSENVGQNWSAPVVLSSPAVNAQPWVAVDARNGAVTVDWLTTQFDPENHRLDVVAAISNDSGATFATVRVTNVSDEPNDDPIFVMGFAPQIGDYQQAFDWNGRMWVLFTANYDLEEGTFQADPFLATVAD